MSDSKKTSNSKQEMFDETKRNKKQNRLRKQQKQKSIFEDMVEEALEDENVYQILKKLKD